MIRILWNYLGRNIMTWELGWRVWNKCGNLRASENWKNSKVEIRKFESCAFFLSSIFLFVSVFFVSFADIKLAYWYFY